MTIDEAIKISTNEYLRTWGDGPSNIRAALQLGIEALKRIKRAKETSRFPGYNPLPGETEE